MKLLQWGNSKLPNMLMWNIPASKEICGRVCSGCYSHKFYRIYPNVLPAQTARYYESLKPDFSANIIKELKRVRKPVKYFRIHASAGEFYSQAYIDSWLDIASAFPSITFYAYTKRLADFDFTALSSLPNFVLINSLHFGKLNYGPLDQAPEDAFICPSSDTVKCGIQCTYCMSKQAQHDSLYFIKH
jgi:sulfatase maturation enzyme AslB (radical SAM superfamily)